jgi:hypothetical protein
MTPQEGYELAKYQRPGFKVVMGPDRAKSQRISAIPMEDLKDLPGFHSWLWYDAYRLYGFVPSGWAMNFLVVAISRDHLPTQEEMEWLHSPRCSLKNVRDWLDGLTEAEGEI